MFSPTFYEWRAQSIRYFLCAMLAMFVAAPVLAVDFEYVKDRLETDMEAGEPIVAHVTVVLCTNRSKQTDLCDENKARTNLYWGAQYGVKTYFSRQKNWQRITTARPQNTPILERVIFRRTLNVNALDQTLYLVADVWRGSQAKQAITHFLTISAGENAEQIDVGEQVIEAGGNAHIMAYLGHNGLRNSTLDLDLPKTTMPNSAIVLGRHTAESFTEPLQNVGSFPLLTTKGLVTPEAYTLEAAIIGWLNSASPQETRNATAAVYAQYQKASLAWTKSLLVAGETE